MKKIFILFSILVFATACKKSYCNCPNGQSGYDKYKIQGKSEKEACESKYDADGNCFVSKE